LARWRLLNLHALAVSLPGDIELRGSGLHSAEFSTAPGATISGPKQGPAFLIAHVEKVQLKDLSILGVHTGVIITDAALVRFSNVGVQAQFAGVLPNEAPCQINGTNDGCNVAFGSNNTAVVVENSFWVWFDTADLAFLPLYDSKGVSLDRKTQWGQRPAVIVRGNKPGKTYGIDTTYLLKFRDVVFLGGAVQYQQVVDGEQWPGFFEFLWCTSEDSATPLLDVQVLEGVKVFEGLESVTISDFAAADRHKPQYLDKYPKIVSGDHSPGKSPLMNAVPIVALNCSHAFPCQLNGLTIISATQSMGCPSCAHPPAVRVFSGEVVGLTVESSQKLGGNDCVNDENVAVGQTVSRSSGGWTVVGAGLPAASCNASSVPANLTAQGVTKSHALLVGVSGESQARLAIETSGEMYYGSGKKAGGFHTGVRQHISNTTAWGPMMIPAGKFAALDMFLVGAKPGDIVTATHAGLGREFALIVSARVVAHDAETGFGTVAVAVHNTGGAAVDLAAGVVRAAIVQYVDA
jgi:hypothetical protein